MVASNLDAGMYGMNLSITNLLTRSLPAFLLLLSCLPAQAADFEPVESIRAAALGAVLSETDDPSRAQVTLDPALRLPRCVNGLRAQATAAATVEVSCSDPSGWRLFVPVKLRRAQSVLTLNRTVAAGSVLSADMLNSETRDLNRVAGASLSNPGDAVGRSARRTLVAGSVLDPGDLVSARLVRRGDAVTLVSHAGSIEVRMAGRALGDAGENERVSVENASSRRIIQGVVGSNGDVLVTR